MKPDTMPMPSHHGLEWFKTLDRHPDTGRYATDFTARLSTSPILDNFFNGSPGYSRIIDVTRGAEYRITGVETFGDVADFTFTNDAGETATLAAAFFE